MAKKKPKVEITKIEVPAVTRKLSGRWTVEAPVDLKSAMFGFPEKKKPTSEMTEEEQAVEILRRLKQTPKERADEEFNTISSELAKALADEIRQEIDNEMMESLKKAFGDKE